MVVVVLVASSPRCGSELYTNTDYKVKPKIGTKACAKSAYKQNPISSCLWLLRLNQLGLKLYKHHFF